MKFPSSLLILIFATDYASAYRRDGLGVPPSDYADIESSQALNLMAPKMLEEQPTTYGRNPERVIVIDATSSNPHLEYGFNSSEDVETEVKETPMARSLRKLIVPTVGKRPNSDDKASLRDLTIPLVSCYCLTTYVSRTSFLFLSFPCCS
jgi:hypothetical protein